MPRHFLTDDDLSKEEVERLFKLAAELKARPVQPLLPSKNLAMIFAKPSTRTRVSFEVGITQLGGSALYLGMNDLQLKRGETIADTARTLSRYVDGIMARLFDHADIVELAKYSSVPVINGLTNSYHPCQALADYMTIKEKKGRLEGLKLVFLGDGANNVATSLIRTGAKLGVQVVIAAPKEFWPKKEILKGTKTKVTDKPKEAVRGADVIYTDVWVSMGDEAEAAKRKELLEPFQVNSSIMKLAKKDAIFMHCLPAHRGEEVTSDVIDGPQSAVWDQAENRLHTQKALMVMLMR
jgi:ornithine carbamoyltransferase